MKAPLLVKLNGINMAIDDALNDAGAVSSQVLSKPQHSHKVKSYRAFGTPGATLKPDAPGLSHRDQPDGSGSAPQTLWLLRGWHHESTSCGLLP